MTILELIATYKSTGCSMKEMRNLYNCSQKTLASWIRPLELQYNGKRWTPKQVCTIFDEIGEPVADIAK